MSNKDVLSECALAAAYSASFPGLAKNPSNVVPVLCEAYPILRSTVKCPQCNYKGELQSVIQHANDGHKMSRESIADWVATLENQMEEKSKEKAVKDAADIVNRAFENVKCGVKEFELEQDNVRVK